MRGFGPGAFVLAAWALLGCSTPRSDRSAVEAGVAGETGDGTERDSVEASGERSDDIAVPGVDMGDGGAETGDSGEASGDGSGDGSPPPDAGGPTLHWKLDEESGMTALDSSGKNHHGTYSGNGGLPAPSPSVPARLASLRSRSFVRAQAQGVWMPLPPELKPTSGVTISVWYQATDVASAGSELVTGGDSYLLRLDVRAVALFKRYGTASTRLVSGRRQATCWTDSGTMSPAHSPRTT